MRRNNFILEIQYGYELNPFKLIIRDIDIEKVYYYNCNTLKNMLNSIEYMCSKLNIKSIYIEISGIGKDYYDCLRERVKGTDISVIPLKYESIYSII